MCYSLSPPFKITTMINAHLKSGYVDWVKNNIMAYLTVTQRFLLKLLAVINIQFGFYSKFSMSIKMKD